MAKTARFIRRSFAILLLVAAIALAVVLLVGAAGCAATPQERQALAQERQQLDRDREALQHDIDAATAMKPGAARDARLADLKTQVDALNARADALNKEAKDQADRTAAEGNWWSLATWAGNALGVGTIVELVRRWRKAQLEAGEANATADVLVDNIGKILPFVPEQVRGDVQNGIKIDQEKAGKRERIRKHLAKKKNGGAAA